MKSNYTHASILLDRSGSMQSIKTDVIGGYNQFIEDQKKVPGEMTVSLSQFDDVYEVLYKKEPLVHIPVLTDRTFVPRNNTALLDSVAKLIGETGTFLSALPEDQRPEKVLFVIITDGHENASREHSRKTIADMVKHQQEKYNWQFIYIGANQDAFAEGAQMGMAGFNFAANSKGVVGMSASLSRSTARFRTAASGDSFQMDDAKEE